MIVTPADVLGELNEVEAKFAPGELYLCGDGDLLRRGPRVAVVGSRRASDDGLRRASVLSRTIAVLGTPLDTFYPRESRELQERIGREHLLVSQFPSGSPTTPKNFPSRDRTMALLTDATVIVEAGEWSGTLHHGWEALRLGRLLFLLESVTQDPALTWPKEMIRYGAQVLSSDNLEVMIENLPRTSAENTIAFEL